jgi:hypothetical protein
MRTLGKVLAVAMGILALFVLATLSQAEKSPLGSEEYTWHKGPYYATRDGKKTYDFYWAEPVKVLSTGNIGMAVALFWTDFGKQVNGVPEGTELTIYVLEVDLTKNQFRYFSELHRDSNNKIIGDRIWPKGKDTWFSSAPGTIGEAWLEIARKALKVPAPPIPKKPLTKAIDT